MSGEAVKQLDRLASNLVHVCGFVWRMDIAKYNSPLNTTGGILGGLGGHKFKSGKAAKWMDRLHQIRYTSVDSSRNGHRLKTIRPTIPHGDIMGGFRGSTIQKPGKCGQTAGPIGNKFCTYNAGESGNGHRLNKLAPWDTRRAFWRGVK